MGMRDNLISIKWVMEEYPAWGNLLYCTKLLNTDKVPVRDYQSDKALLCNLPSILMLFQNGSKSNHK